MSARPPSKDEEGYLRPCSCSCHTSDYPVYCEQCCDGPASLYATLDAERARAERAESERGEAWAVVNEMARRKTEDELRWDETRAALAAAVKERDALMDALEYAWTIICNAGGGDWTRESSDWQEAAAKMRDEYHARLDARRLRAAAEGR